MDRAKAIEWLEQLRDEEELNAKLFEMDEHPRDMDNPHTPWVEMYEMAIDALREQLVTGCNQWISVEERLPDEDCTAIAVVTGWNGRYVDVVVWDSVHSKFCRHVTHWMPLPEPPEGGAEG